MASTSMLQAPRATRISGSRALLQRRQPLLSVTRPLPSLRCAARMSFSVMASSSSKTSGTVLWFNTTKGFGFIRPDDGSSDLFVHQTQIETDGFRSLREGEAVEFVVESQRDGRLQAVSVTGPGGAPPQGEVKQDRDSWDNPRGGAPRGAGGYSKGAGGGRSAGGAREGGRSRY